MNKEEVNITEMLKWLEDKELALQANIKSCKEEIRCPSKDNFYIDATFGSHVAALRMYNETLSMIRGIKKELEEKTNTQNHMSKPILTDKEKVYFKNVLRPFQKRVGFVILVKNTFFLDQEKNVRIKVHLKDHDFLILPFFKEGTMYKAMQPNVKYTLKDLGITYE